MNFRFERAGVAFFRALDCFISDLAGFRFVVTVTAVAILTELHVCKTFAVPEFRSHDTHGQRLEMADQNMDTWREKKRTVSSTATSCNYTL